MQRLIPASIKELRFQTGFFGARGIGLLAPILENLRARSCLVRALVGSNDRGTAHDDVAELVDALGIPRRAAFLGVCAFGSGFFHPKVVHIRRVNGGQAAYVGSANLTGPGIDGHHIEAGVLLDTAEGDASNMLDQVAAAIDGWFTNKPDGFYPVQSLGSLAELVAKGVLAKVAEPVETRRPPRKTAGGAFPQLPRLKPLLAIPTSPTAKTAMRDKARVGSIRGQSTGFSAAGAAVDVYLMELSKNRPSKKSYQAELTYKPFLDYFGGKLGGKVGVTLNWVRNDGSRTKEIRQLVNSKSQNYRVEIGAFVGKQYPRGSKRPIVGFYRTSTAAFDYMLLMPGDNGYSKAVSLLTKYAVINRPTDRRRTFITKEMLEQSWPSCPLLAR